MSALSERIIAENYNSVVAAQDMKESLERQDSAGLFVLLDRWDRAVPQLREHRARFDAAYQRAAANITEPGEAEVVNAIGRTRDDYYRRSIGSLLDVRSRGLQGASGVGRRGRRVLPPARAGVHRAAPPMRSAADPQSGCDAKEGRRSGDSRTALVPDDARNRSGARRRRDRDSRRSCRAASQAGAATH